MNQDEIRHRSLQLAMSREGVNAPFSEIIAQAEIIAHYLQNGNQAEIIARLHPDGNKPSDDHLLDTIERWLASEPDGFRLFPYQKTILSVIDKSPRTIIRHARQSGITSILACYALWYAAFHRDQTVLVMAPRYASALELLDRIRLHASRDVTLAAQVTDSPKGIFRLTTGSRIIARAQSSDAGRGLPPHCLIMDNADAFSHSFLREFLQRVQPAGHNGLKCIIAGTEMHDDGPFRETWNDPAWHRLEIPWYVHPRRDGHWAADMRVSLGDAAFSREFLVHDMDTK